MAKSMGYIPNQDQCLQNKPFRLSALMFSLPEEAKRDHQVFLVSGILNLLFDVLSVFLRDFKQELWIARIDEIHLALPTFDEYMEMNNPQFVLNGGKCEVFSVSLHANGIGEMDTDHSIAMAPAKNRNEKIRQCVECARSLGLNHSEGQLLTATRAFHHQILMNRGLEGISNCT